MPRRDVWDLIFANVRARETVEADMHAQVGACRVGARELEQLVAKYGVATFRRHCAALLDATEEMMRAAIRSFPDGEFTGEVLVNTDMWGALKQPVAACG